MCGRDEAAEDGGKSDPNGKHGVCEQHHKENRPDALGRSVRNRPPKPGGSGESWSWRWRWAQQTEVDGRQEGAEEEAEEEDDVAEGKELRVGHAKGEEKEAQEDDALDAAVQANERGRAEGGAVVEVQ